MDRIPEQTIGAELGPGERLIWAGKPREGLALRSSDYFLIPFSLVWGGFAIFWEFMAYSLDGPVPLLLFGSVFVAVGLYLIVGRFFGDSWMRSRTTYGLTNQRAIIVKEAFGKNVRSIRLKAVAEVGLKEQPDLTGTITFGSNSVPSSWAPGPEWPGMWSAAAPRFEMIDRARIVYDQIRTIQSGPDPAK